MVVAMSLKELESLLSAVRSNAPAFSASEERALELLIIKRQSVRQRPAQTTTSNADRCLQKREEVLNRLTYDEELFAIFRSRHAQLQKGMG